MSQNTQSWFDTYIFAVYCFNDNWVSIISIIDFRGKCIITDGVQWVYWYSYQVGTVALGVNPTLYVQSSEQHLLSSVMHWFRYLVTLCARWCQAATFTRCTHGVCSPLSFFSPKISSHNLGTHWFFLSPFQIVGDDLTVTNIDRVQKAIDVGACNCLLLKVNQIGTFSESLAAAQLARKNGWGVMVSHRSGETEDSTIADIVVGLSVGQVSQHL